MKKLFIILFLLVATFTYCRELKLIKKLYAFDYEGKEIYVGLYKYGHEMGFKVGNVYFMTDYETFRRTIKKQRKTQSWITYTLGHKKEILRVQYKIYAMSIYNYEVDYIQFVFIIPYGDDSMIHNYLIEIKAKYIKKYL